MSESKPIFGMVPFTTSYPTTQEEAAQSTRLICQHCGRDYKDKSSLRVHNFKKHRHLNASSSPTHGSSAAAALVATSVQMAQEEHDAYQEQQRLQLYHHQLRLQQLQARAASADLERPHDTFHHNDDEYYARHHDDDDELADPAAAAATAFPPRFRPHQPLLQTESHKRGATQQPSFAAMAMPATSASHMSIDVTTRLLPVLNPAVDETGKRRRVGERFTPTPIGSVTKRSKAAFLPVYPHTASASTGMTASTTADAITGTSGAPAPSAEHFELDASELAKNLSMLNDLADVALATSRNPQ